MAFNLLDGIGFAILGPRMLDTFLGCLLSYALGLAVAGLAVQAAADPDRQFALGQRPLPLGGARQPAAAAG